MVRSRAYRTSRASAAWTSAAARRLIDLAGEPSSIEEAVRIVVRRLMEGVPSPPTDLASLQARLNISALESMDLPISGELRPDGKGFKIVYSSHLSPARRRFTIAHEMAHAIFESTGRNCPRVGKELERLCDMLATEIVMPREVFLKEAGDGLSLIKLSCLANTFGTSLSATAIRCAELFGISTFEVDCDRVRWGYGVIQRGSLQSLDNDLRDIALKAIAGETGERLLHITTGQHLRRWKVEYGPIGRTNRALLFLTPVRRTAEMPGS